MHGAWRFGYAPGSRQRVGKVPLDSALGNESVDLQTLRHPCLCFVTRIRGLDPRQPSLDLLPLCQGPGTEEALRVVVGTALHSHEPWPWA